MAGPIRNSEIIRRLIGEARTALRLSPWLLLSLLLVLILWQADTAALAGLFQSPPTDTPTATAPQVTDTPLATPTLEPTITPTLAITETATPLPSDTPTVMPSETPTFTPTEPLPAGEDSLTPPPAEEEGNEAVEDGRQRYPQGESGLRFEWGMLFDAVALALSYTWLCCGAFIVLGVPLFFLALWVASTVRRQRTE